MAAHLPAFARRVPFGAESQAGFGHFYFACAEKTACPHRCASEPGLAPLGTATSDSPQRHGHPDQAHVRSLVVRRFQRILSLCLLTAVGGPWALAASEPVSPGTDSSQPMPMSTKASCVASCNQGRTAMEQFCRSIPDPRIRPACWIAAMGSTVVCINFCHNYS